MLVNFIDIFYWGGGGEGGLVGIENVEKLLIDFQASINFKVA
jgi:hypothetical protein